MGAGGPRFESWRPDEPTPTPSAMRGGVCASWHLTEHYSGRYCFRMGEDNLRIYPFLLAGELRQGDSTWTSGAPIPGPCSGGRRWPTPLTSRPPLTRPSPRRPRRPRSPRTRGRPCWTGSSRGWPRGRRSWPGSSPPRPGSRSPWPAPRSTARVFVFRQGAEEATRIGGEVIPMDLPPHGERRLAHHPPLPRRADLGHHPVQLSRSSSRPTSWRPRSPAAPPWSSRCRRRTRWLDAPPRRDRRRAPAIPPGAHLHPALHQRRRRAADRRPAGPHGHLHRLRARRMGHPPARLHQARDARAGRQRRRASSSPMPTSSIAVRRCVAGGYLYAGQSCISTQRILVHESLYRPLHRAVRGRRRRTPHRRPAGRDHRRRPDDRRGQRQPRGRSGSPRRWPAGARLAVGGTREGAILQPDGAARHHSGMRVNCEEVFGPVTTVRPYTDFDEAIDDGERFALGPPGRALHQRHAAHPARASSGSTSAAW